MAELLPSPLARLVTRAFEEPSEGTTLIVKMAGAGEILGVSATILGNAYEVSAETVETAQVNFIKRDDFLRLLNSHADACMHTAKQLSEKYQLRNYPHSTTRVRRRKTPGLTCVG